MDADQSLRKIDLTHPATKFNDDARATFLDYLGKFGVVQTALDACGVSRSTLKKHLADDKRFAEAVEDAKEEYADRLEFIAHEFAFGKIKEAVFWQGRKMETFKYVQSESILTLLLKANRPAKFNLKDQPDVNIHGGVLLAPAPYTDMEKWCADNDVEIIYRELEDPSIKQLGTAT